MAQRKTPWGYARNSTTGDGERLENQVARLKRAGATEVIQELVSGRNNDRPGIVRLIKAVQAGKVSKVLVTRVDRLGRDTEFVGTLLGLCDIYEVPVEAINGGRLSLATPQDWMMAKQLTTIAEFESRMLSQRINTALEQYRHEGRHLRNRIVFGYRVKDKVSLELHPDEAPIARKIIERLAELKSFRSVSRELPEWSPFTPSTCNLENWFANPILRGHIPVRLKKFETEGSKRAREKNPLLKPKLYPRKGFQAEWEEIWFNRHEPLISEEEYNELAAILSIRKPDNFADSKDENGCTQPRHGLTGIGTCMSCRSRLRRTVTVRGVHWWRCFHRTCKDKAGIREDEFITRLSDYVAKHADSLTRLDYSDKKPDPKIDALKKQLHTTREMAAANPEIFDPVVRRLESQLELLTRPDPEQISPQLAKVLALVVDPRFTAEADPYQQRTIFSALLQEVRVGRVTRIRAGTGKWKALGDTPFEVVPRRYASV